MNFINFLLYNIAISAEFNIHLQNVTQPESIIDCQLCVQLWAFYRRTDVISGKSDLRWAHPRDCARVRPTPISCSEVILAANSHPVCVHFIVVLYRREVEMPSNSKKMPEFIYTKFIQIYNSTLTIAPSSLIHSQRRGSFKMTFYKVTIKVYEYFREADRNFKNISKKTSRVAEEKNADRWRWDYGISVPRKKQTHRTSLHLASSLI